MKNKLFGHTDLLHVKKSKATKSLNNVTFRGNKSKHMIW